MKVIELKAVLHRSNPSVIRQFTVPMEVTVGQLSEMLLLLTGMIKSGYWHISSPERKIKENETVGEIFGSEIVVSFEYADAVVIAGRKEELGGPGNPNKGLLFRVTSLGEKEQEETYPVLTHWRGDNLPEGVFDVSLINRYRLWKSKGDYIYYSNEFREISYGDYGFSQQAASRKLKKMFAANDADAQSVLMELDYENACSMQEILSGLTAQELKSIAATENLRLPTGLRKEQMVSQLVQGLSEARVFERHMVYMTAGEYEIFKAICIGKSLSTFSPEVVDDVIERFYDCGFMDTYYGNGYGGKSLFDVLYEHDHAYDEKEINVTEELLTLYEAWMEEGKEKDFLRKAQAYTMIMGYIELYGYVEKKDWMEQMGKLPGETYSEDELKSIWQEYAQYCRQKKATSVGQFYASVLYAKNAIDERSFPHILDELRNIPHYRPDIEELRKIEAEGLHFSQVDAELLENFFRYRGRLYGDASRELTEFAYTYMHNGVDEKVYLDVVSKRYYIKDKKIISELKDILHQLQPTVRQIQLGGYTEDEMRAMSQAGAAAARKKEKRIYPNDPCPCGSGKKYKNCHGRNR